MFSHVMVGADDLAAARRFYDAVFATLGIASAVADDRGRLFWRQDGRFFAVNCPRDGAAATGANGGTIGFIVAGPDQADAWHAAGMAAGGTACEDPPGWRDYGSHRQYLAYLRDPAGNKLCAFHEAA